MSETMKVRDLIRLLHDLQRDTNKNVMDFDLQIAFLDHERDLRYEDMELRKEEALPIAHHREVLAYVNGVTANIGGPPKISKYSPMLDGYLDT